MPERESGGGPRQWRIDRAADRFLTTGDGMRTWHSFSYGAHYDPDNIGFGQLTAFNDETLAPGAGYDLHHHGDTEIVTWVLSGGLLHEDSTGHSGIIGPGTMQRLSAGTGVQHSERNASQTEPLHFIQMMLRSDNDAEPAYEQREIVTPATPSFTAGVPVLQSRAAVQVGHLGAGESLTVQSADFDFVFIAQGAVSLFKETMNAGDATRLTGMGRYDLSAVDLSAVDLSATERSEVLIWQMSQADE